MGENEDDFLIIERPEPNATSSHDPIVLDLKALGVHPTNAEFKCCITYKCRVQVYKHGMIKRSKQCRAQVYKHGVNKRSKHKCVGSRACTVQVCITGYYLKLHGFGHMKLHGFCAHEATRTWNMKLHGFLLDFSYLFRMY